MRIAIINCLKANSVCTGAACLQAMNQRTKRFASYQDEEIVLAAFMRCSGCGKYPNEDPGMREKMERLLNLSLDAVHLGKCTTKEEGLCPVIEEAKSILEQAGIPVIFGTH